MANWRDAPYLFRAPLRRLGVPCLLTLQEPDRAVTRASYTYPADVTVHAVSQAPAHLSLEAPYRGVAAPLARSDGPPDAAVRVGRVTHTARYVSAGVMQTSVAGGRRDARHGTRRAPSAVHSGPTAGVPILTKAVRW